MRRFPFSGHSAAAKIVRLCSNQPLQQGLQSQWHATLLLLQFRILCHLQWPQRRRRDCVRLLLLLRSTRSHCRNQLLGCNCLKRMLRRRKKQTHSHSRLNSDGHRQMLRPHLPEYIEIHPTTKQLISHKLRILSNLNSTAASGKFMLIQLF